MKLLITTLTLLLASTSYAATLKKINSYAKDGAFYTEMTFDQPVTSDQVSLDFINETVQVNLSNTDLDKSNISTKVSDEKVNSIYTYKLDNNSTRTRIIYKKGIEATQFQANTTVEIQGKKAIVKVLDRGLPPKVEVAEKVSDEDLDQAAKWLENADKKDTEAAIAAEIAVTEEEKKALANRKESEIPVLATKTSGNTEKKAVSASRIIISLGLVLGLLFGFSFFLKKFLKKNPAKKNSQIKILTQHYLGPKKSLAIIRVAGESMLVGITDQNINLIKTLALLDEEIPQDTPNNFSKSLANSMSNGNSEFAAADDEEAEEFSFSKIKDFVSGRLKNMKEL